MSETPEPPPSPPPPSSEPLPQPPPLPQRVLDYHQPLPRRSPAFTSGAFLRFTCGFALMFVLVMGWFGGIAVIPFVFNSFIPAVLGGSIVAVTAVVRQRFAEEWVAEKNKLLTILAGAGCVLLPTAVYVSLLGRTETLPWVLTTWLISCIMASYVISPPPAQLS